MVELSAIAHFVRGVTFKPHDVVPMNTPEAVACIRTKNVQRTIDLSDVWGLAPALVRRPEQFLEEGDILVSTANSWNLVGKCCSVPALPWPATFGGFISVLRPDRARVHPQFLYRWMSARYTQETLRSLGQRTTSISNLNLERCLRLSVPLPDLVEQRRIAGVLDSADCLEEQRLKALDHLQELKASIAFEMFGDPVQNSKHWPDGRALGDIADVVSGVTLGRKVRDSATREIKYLAVVNVQDQRLDLSTVKTVQATEVEIERYRLCRGDLLLTEGGDPDKLGRGCLWTGELPECIHQNHIFRVRVNSADVTPQYLNWLVGSPRGKRYFLRSAKQTTGIASINSRQLRAFPLLVPPLALQQEFGLILDHLVTVEEEMAAGQRELEGLFASLEYRAFRGNL